MEKHVGLVQGAETLPVAVEEAVAARHHRIHGAGCLSACDLEQNKGPNKIGSELIQVAMPFGSEIPW